MPDKLTDSGKMKSVEATLDSKLFKLITPVLAAAILGVGTMVWNKIETIDEKVDQNALILNRIDLVNNSQEVKFQTVDERLKNMAIQVRELERTDDRMFRAPGE